jgi:DNA-binding MarR family transcriptional regulator
MDVQAMGACEQTENQTCVPVQQGILVSLRRIIRAIDLYSRQLMDQHGLTGPQLATLQEIARIERVSPTELARRLQISQATVTGILDRLEKRGFINRSRNGDDRRGVEVGITEAGRQMLVNAPPLLQDRFCQELAKLPDWEQNMLLANLQRIAAMMNVENLDAAPHLVTGADRL